MICHVLNAERGTPSSPVPPDVGTMSPLAGASAVSATQSILGNFGTDMPCAVVLLCFLTWKQLLT